MLYQHISVMLLVIFPQCSSQRSQEVVRVSNTGEIAPDEECSISLWPSDVENCDMGPVFN